MAELFRSRSGKSQPALYGEGEPIRGELFSVERLEQFAVALAPEHYIVMKKGRARLLPRLEDNGRKLVAAYRTLVEAVRQGDSISPAAEWLLDNFHIVEEQLREIREDLPKGYYHELPKLAAGELADYPRIYAVALALIAHTDSRLDPLTLRRFIAAYQTVSPLSIGELWAVAISLRLALVENLRRLATQIVRWRDERAQADKFADKLLELAASQPEDLVALVADRFAKRDKVPRAFIVELMQRLREQDTAVTPVFNWIEKQLRAQATSIEQVMQSEHQRQAAAQVTVGNIITSMRLLSTLDWRDFFESVSLIEPILGQDPAGAYLQMEFASRDRYRHVIERISKRTNSSEVEISRTAVDLARKASEAGAPKGVDDFKSHVGFYLSDDGLPLVEEAFKYRPGLVERLRRCVLRHPTFAYLGTLILLTSVIVALLGFGLYRAGGTLPLIMVMALLAILPASDLALSVLNFDITNFFEPHVLSRMNTSQGVPDNARTMVVVPTIFSSVEVVDNLVEKLEVLFLANEDDCIHFALLGDFADAPAAEMPDDVALLEAALAGIERLNDRYGKEGQGERPRFYLFHRRRLWNPSEEKWMGWERKRGKLRELNRLLRGARDTSFIVQTGEQHQLADFRYVITLDADTQLPRDVARRLIGTAIHPLNRPLIDPRFNRVTRGYGILQPRVSVSLVSSCESRFAGIFSGNTGIDPYTTAVSDVYQDLFGEGNYTGKGLYDVDAFEQTLGGRVPENTLLSHDLFESLFARAALVTDIELLDDYPTHYDTYAKRQHRWIRGDWQVAPWLFQHARDESGRPVRNNLPWISRWKIFDNLRRSLTAPAIVLWLLASWTILPGSPWLWSLFVVITMAFPVYMHVTTSVMTHPRGVPWTSHFWSVWGDLRTNTAQFALTFIFVGHQACLSTDAILRTLYRQFISHKHLLEWVTAADTERASKHDLKSFLRYMWAVGPLALEALSAILLSRTVALWEAAPFIFSWLVSPFVAWWVSRRIVPENRELAGEDLIFARLIARRTWRFFETFVGAEDNWLPPDNYQEDPVPVIAHRTSPTNIGFLLISTAAAHDLGYIGALELTEREELTFATLARLPRFHGHFFNWYDTRTLDPLLPQYISTVDSGNLAGHFIALKQFCIELQEGPVFGERTRLGLADTIALISEEAGRLGTIRQRTEVITIKHLREEIEACQRLVGTTTPDTLFAWATLFDSLSRRAAIIEDIVGALTLEHGQESFADLSWWISALRHQLRGLRRDTTGLVPWADIRTTEIEAFINGAAAPIRERWDAVKELCNQIPALAEIPERCDQVIVELAVLQAQVSETDSNSIVQTSAVGNLKELAGKLESAVGSAKDFLARLRRLAQNCESFFHEMDFSFLLDKDRELFTIGYNVGELRPDNSYYDLLASEARVASFVGIAKGDVPQDHWFRLGRQLTLVHRARALISWTGTMFEYLMPLLIMRSYPETLLEQTFRAVVTRQIEYGEERGVPWGISESAYNARDLHLNYQYAPFGVPGLGLKRGLVQDLVVAPYATMLAASIDSTAAMANLVKLRQEGALARYGFYEAIDYTPERLPQNQRLVLIRAFMAHHQGMSLVALDNALNNGLMESRFHADPLVRATDLLLQERIPQGVPATRPRAEEVLIGRVARSIQGNVTRVYRSADQSTPRTQLLSNGNYMVMMTAAGSGYSQCGERAVTRWREDATRDDWGTFIYLREVFSGTVWSAGHQPVRRPPQSYEVSFAEDKAEFWRADSGIVTHTEIVVSPEENAEVRQVSLTNNSTRTSEIELTSYAEIVLAPARADAAHPAFGNLFIETEFSPAQNALLAHRRQYSSDDTPVWGVHVVLAEGAMIGGVQYETDRGRFLGRGHTVSNPVAVMEERPLSNTVGAVLDPVFSLRCRVRLRPNETARVTFTTAVASSREEALTLADKYHDPNTFERQSRLAWTRAQVEMTHLSIGPEDAHLFQKLAGRVMYCDAALRPRPYVLALNTKGQSGLWPYGISGDLPIILVRVGSEEGLRSVRQILHGHEYLHYKGLKIDLVILNDHPPSYIQSLHDELQAIVRTSGLQGLQDKPGGVYLRRSDLMPDEDRILLHAVARVVLVTERGSLEEQIDRRPVEEPLPPAFTPRLPARPYVSDAEVFPELSFFNGLGGFVQDGREYVTVLGEGQWTPAPWSNVIAHNPHFGFQVTESGAGYTWSVNSRENRLTPWSNDAVSDPPGEIFYLRDEETGEIWSPTPLPIREAETYTIRHGQGYSVFEHNSHGISQELLLFTPPEDPVKISLLRLRNRSDRRRVLSVTSYNELVLGVLRSTSAPYIITEIDKTGSVFARNPYNNEFASRVTFAATNGPVSSATCDRKEFVGRNGSIGRPAALRRSKLSGRDGAGLDPCIAIQTTVELQPGEAREIVFLLGEAESKEKAGDLVARYRQGALVNQAFDDILNSWDKLLGAVQVRTPDAAMDLMMNRWLVYQTLSCRIQARTAFYQSGGAYGFRDQLQDVMALVYGDPQTARAQIVRAAHHQFKEGDVQHWWHPPTGRGVRTKFSDDLLWLPLVAAFYVSVTGDKSVLDEVVPFLEAPLLGPDEHETYLQPTISADSAPVFDHCVRALNRSLGVGQHGLPLMGAGDWNDGMNRVGYLGKGESVWLGWFLYTTLDGFVPFCEQRGETELADRYRTHMDNLQKALNQNAWDGDWYRRAYFDDGTPLGSAQNEECRIDSIAQSWGVISGAAEPHRAVRAMAAVDEYLIRRGDGLVLLFTPPFDKSNLNPGYIKGYAPGVRENGGQYTHGAIWTMIAFALLGQGDRSGELFSLLNPINHASTRAGLHKYKVEPYVAAGDVYAVPPHTGRGGWTWYTGSAGWMYRAGLESILGFHLRADRLRLEPCIPRWWREFEITYRRGHTTWRIMVENPTAVSRGVVSVELDGKMLPDREIQLVDDRAVHNVRVVLGEVPVKEEVQQPGTARFQRA
ncbi:MAG: phosphorylase [Acidobacteria bacterium]|nr:phosphorylase [Acidobacteriota bacterium]